MTETSSNASSNDVMDMDDGYDWNSASLHANPCGPVSSTSQTMHNHENFNLESLQGTTPTKWPNSPGTDSDDTAPPRPSVVLESVDDTLLRLSNSFESIVEENADTLVYIGCPPRKTGQSGQSVSEYTQIEHQFRQPYLMRSSTLRNLGSAKFDKFLGLMSARVERRLKKEGLHNLVSRPESIKYYIDLSPRIDGDDALIEITQLSVPSGALKWHQVAGDFAVLFDRVGGRDNIDVSYKPVLAIKETTKLDEDKAKSATASSISAPCSNIRDEMKPVGYSFDMEVEEEYTQLRHHTTTARLLHAIVGNDPKLNSAAKAWTFCMLASYFDCASNGAVSHWLVSWLLQDNNHNFIQANPDVAYRMAVATQSTWLLRCSFAILVGQQAMLDSINDTTNGGHPRTRERIATCLDEDDLDRIDHAASALAQRVRTLFKELTCSPGIWAQLGRETEMGKLDKLEFIIDKDWEEVRRVRAYLQEYVQRIIYMTLSDSYPHDNKNLTAFKPFKQYTSYLNMPRPLRILTQYFWEVLRQEEFTRDYVNNPNNHTIWAETRNALVVDGIMATKYPTYISKMQFVDAVTSLNKAIIANREFEGQEHGRVRFAGYCNRIEQTPLRRPYTPETPGPAKRVRLSPGPKSGVDDGAGNIFNRTDNFTRPTCQFVAEESPDTVDQSKQEPVINTTDVESLTSQDSCEYTSKHDADSQKDHGTDSSNTEGGDWEEFITLGLSDTNNAVGHSLPLRQKLTNIPGPFSLPSSQDAARSLTVETAEQTVPFGTVDKIHFSEGFGTLALSQHHNQNEESQSTTLTQPLYVPHTVPEDPYTRPQHVCASGADVNQPTNNSLHDHLPENDPLSTHTSTPLYNNPTSQNPTSLPVTNSSHHPTYTPAPARPKPPISTKTPPPKRSQSMRSPKSSDLIAPLTLLDEISGALHAKLANIVTPGYILDKTCDFDISTSHISTLLCLSDAEYKYLPLWAGGLDDGSGGVFEDDREIIDAPGIEDGGFRGGAIGVIPGVGSTVGGSVAGSEFEDLGTEVGVSTVGRASRYAADGTNATETVMGLDD